MSTPEQVAADLRRMVAAVDTESERVLNGLGVNWTVLAKALVHIRTGLLQASLHPEGPFSIAVGTLEEVISPSPANYAIYEIARGGDHDYASQTIDAGAPQLETAAQALGAAIVAYLRGG